MALSRMVSSDALYPRDRMCSEEMLICGCYRTTRVKREARRSSKWNTKRPIPAAEDGQAKTSCLRDVWKIIRKARTSEKA